MLPASFDLLLLQDDLIQTLQRSPITQQFAVLRAEELLQAVIEKPIINALKAEVERLQSELAEEKKLKRTMRSDSKRQTNMTVKESAQKQAHISALREEVEQLSHRLDEATHSSEYYQQLCQQQKEQLKTKGEEIQEMKANIIRQEKEVEMLSQRKEQLDAEIKIKDSELKAAAERHTITQNQYQSKIREIERNSVRKEEQLQRQIKSRIQLQLKDKMEHQSQMKAKEKIIQSLKDERFQLKNEINGLKIDISQIKAENQSLKKQEETSGIQLQQLRDGLRQIKIGFDRERKMLNNRLHDLTKTSKAHLKLKNHLKQAAKSLTSLKQEHMRMARTVADLLRKLGQQNQRSIRGLLDAVGEKVAKEVQELAAQLKAQAEEVRVAKGEVRAKEQVIDRLQKQLSGGSRQVADLRNDAKQHKREQQRLRRELKRVLEQNQAKLSMMERKYAQLYNRVTY